MRGIPDLKFDYITLISQKPPNHFDHMVLLVSDLAHPGKHMIIGSDTVTYLESKDILAEIKKRYSGYIGFQRSNTAYGGGVPF